MSMYKTTIFLIFSILTVSCHADQSEKTQASMFSRICFKAGGDKEVFLSIINSLKIGRIPKENEKYFLHGEEGEVWGYATGDTVVAITWLKDNRCSFLIKEANVTEFSKRMNTILGEYKNKDGVIFSPTLIPENQTDVGPITMYVLQSDSPPFKKGDILYFWGRQNKSDLAIVISVYFQKNG